MKMTKAQEDFLGLCWKMKVVNIIPQAAKLGIPEAEVRKYLATKGMAIEQGGFVFQGGWKPRLKEEGVKAEDFMAAVEVANRDHTLAIRRYLRIEKKGDLKKAAAAKEEIRNRHDEIVWLVGGLFAPARGTWGRLARKTMVELIKEKKG